jgi:tRNA (guanine37-N1)-methyltransferase
LGKSESGHDESFEQGLLEYPHFTRPREWEGHGIPEVLLGGDHARIARWRREQAEALTRERRPDLLDKPSRLV